MKPSDLIFAVQTTLAAVVLSLLLRGHMAPVNLAMFYIMNVVAVATRGNRPVAIGAALVSVAAFDFFCVPPYLTFAIEDQEYLVTFVGMLVVALVIGTQSATLKRQRTQAEERQVHTEALYRMARGLAAETGTFEAAKLAAEQAGEALNVKVELFLSEKGIVSFRRRTADYLVVPPMDEKMAQRAFDSGRPESTPAALYLPIRGTRSSFGVMAVLHSGESNPLAQAFADQIGLVLERIQSRREAEDTRVKMETEQMRSSLLSAVSHDLRTPLASITGAASTMLTQSERLSEETRTELLEDIAEEADRLNRLVTNLIDMTKFQSGAVSLKREFCPLDEIAEAALQRCEKRLRGRPVRTLLPDGLPPVYADELLLGQVLINLVENALKYTPAASEIEIEAAPEADGVRVEVRDRGPGYPPGEEERIFDKFYRRGPTGTQGAGLGLAICKAIVEAHGGRIAAHNRVGGGAVFSLSLPAGVQA